MVKRLNVSGWRALMLGIELMFINGVLLLMSPFMFVTKKANERGLNIIMECYGRKWKSKLRK